MQKILRSYPLRLLSSFIPAFLLYLVALHFHWMSAVDQKVYDVGLSLKTPRAEPAEIVLVAIDKNSLQESFPFPPFPVSRHLYQHAELVRRLDAAGAGMVVFDIMFDRVEEYDTAAVAAFRTALNETRKVVLAAAVEKNTPAAEGLSADETFSSPPAFISAASAGLGVVNMPIDGDGLVRRGYFGKAYGGRRYQSMAAVIFELSRGEPYRTEPGENEFLIDYSWFGPGLQSVPFNRVVSGHGWEGLVKDKIVLVGVTENGSIDMYKVPVSRTPEGRNARLSGVEIQAVAAQTLLSGSRLEFVGQTGLWSIGFILLLVLTGLFSRVSPVWSLAATVLVLVLLLTGVLLAVAVYSLLIRVGALALAVIGAALVTYALNQMALKIETVSQERIIRDIEEDLVSAKDTQKNLQPVEFPINDRYEITARQITCKAVGGDYYDVISLPGNKIGLLMADVSGKGVAGSLVMSNMQGRFRRVAGDILSPGKVLKELNDLVAEATRTPQKFVTVVYGVLDYETGRLTYGNAGHCEPLVCSAAGRVRKLGGGGPMLGPFKDLQWDDYSTEMKKGDVLCLYTDGVSEAGGDEPKKQFCEERIIKCLEEKHDEPVEIISDYLFLSCKEHVSGRAFEDDWTLMLLKIH
ncbi:MAG: SpoIIE family protein phosphatase [candidate division Zixibacteria bacterium]|nr:SpoIIE family protein phosphatase [candidate division Zixibacteria bacterium]